MTVFHYRNAKLHNTPSPRISSKVQSSMTISSVVLITLMLLDEKSVMLDEMRGMLVCNNSLSPKSWVTNTI